MKLKAMTNRTVAIFDLDGTLTDSKPGIVSCLRQALNNVGIDYQDSLDWFIGPPVEYSMARLMPQADAPARDAVLRAYRACYDQRGWSENAVYPGVPELLAGLQSRGVALFVCTSKREHFAIRVLESFGLAPYFRAIYADRGDRPHTKAELLADLLREQAIDSSTAVMIGDRHYDLEAARANHIGAVAVTYGYGTREELEACTPDVIAASPAEILRAFQPAVPASSLP